jgi:uncharacterized protein
MFRDLNLKVNVQKETCMATRFPYGSPFTGTDLKRIEECEDLIRQISGVSQIRMRVRDGAAYLLTSPETIRLLTENEAGIRSALLAKGVTDVNIDQKGYEG